MKGKIGVAQQEILDLLRCNGGYATWYQIGMLRPKAYTRKAYSWPRRVVDGLRARGLVRYSTADGAILTEAERKLIAKARAEHRKASSFVILAVK